MEYWHVIFSGQVQGVGFRYTAKHFADLLGVYGWVSNLPDGTVKLAAQGKESKKLIDSLNQKFNSQAEIKKMTGEKFISFEIL